MVNILYIISKSMVQAIDRHRIGQQTIAWISDEVHYRHISAQDTLK